MEQLRNNTEMPITTVLDAAIIIIIIIVIRNPMLKIENLPKSCSVVRVSGSKLQKEEE
jgi:hypothetical protein